MKTISRRRFLKVGAVCAVGAGVSAVVGGAYVWPRRSEIYQSFVSPAIDEEFGSLADGDLKILLGVAEILYPHSNETDRRQLHEVVEEWVDSRTNADGRLGVYRNGVETLKSATADAGFQRAFHELSEEERSAILNGVRSPSGERPKSREASPVEQLRFVLRSVANREEYRRWALLVELREELVTGIYSSRLGWSQVGYETWPGVGGDPTGYVEPPMATRL